MLRSHTQRTAAGTLAAVFGLVAVLALIRLAGLGFVVTHGTSMAPRFQTGDLAVTRASKTYQVGDAVAYRSGTLRTVVLHRIIRAEGNRFVTKGDNNSWTDPDHPTGAEIRGRLLIHVPGAGRLFPQAGGAAVLMHNPITVLSAVLLLLAGRARRLQRSRRRRRPFVQTQHRPPTRSRGHLATSPGVLIAAALGVGVLAVAAIWLAPRPGGTATSATPTGGAPATPAGAAPATGASREERLTVEYSGHTSADAAYPDGSVTTGDPIFVKAVRQLSVTATYQGQLGGPVTISAELAHPSGWRRPLPLSLPTSTPTSATGTLDVAATTSLIRRFADETGLPAPGTTVVLVATTGSWATRSVLTFDGVQFQVDAKTLTAVRGTFPSATGQPAQTHPVLGNVAPLRALAPLGRLLPTTVLRAWATLGVLLLLAAGVDTLRRRRQGKASLPTHRLVPVAAPTPAAGRTVVNLAHPSELARVADRADLAIFQTTTPDGQDYLVDDGAVLYRLHQPSQPRPAVLPAVLADSQFRLNLNARLLAHIAEELRGPLTAVLGSAEVLAEDPPRQMTPVQLGMLTRITRGADRLQRLGDTLTLLTDLETGTARPPGGMVDLGTIIDDRCEPLARTLAGRQINIAQELEPALPLVPGDAAKLSRALDELLSNAVDASSPGSTITVGARRTDHDLTVTVTASGQDEPTGMAATTEHGQHRGMEPQRGLDADLGLTLARAIVTHHHGQIHFVTDQRAGLVATVELPVS
jgi:signal peptidase I